MGRNTADEYRFECYEEYFGDKEQVLRKMDHCTHCGSKLVFSHLPDYKGLIIQETARCMDCGQVMRKLISILN